MSTELQEDEQQLLFSTPVIPLLDLKKKESFKALYSSLNISSRKIGFNGSNKGETSSFKDSYPLTWNYPCSYCADMFNDDPNGNNEIPWIKIHKWNEKTDSPVFNISRAFCSGSCYQDYLTNSADYNRCIEAENVARFAEKYLGISMLNIKYCDISLRKDRSPFGRLTKEEWRETRKTAHIFIATPPMMFVDTFESAILKKGQKPQLDFKINLTVTEANQKNFEEIIANIKKKKTTEKAPHLSAIVVPTDVVNNNNNSIFAIPSSVPTQETLIRSVFE